MGRRKSPTSLASLAEAAGVHRETFRDRIRSGWTIEEASQPVRQYRKKRYPVFGEWLRLFEASEKYGVAASTLHGRMKQGRTLEQAIKLSQLERKQ